MNAKQKLHQAQLREWAARFADQKASGLPVRTWCEQNQLTIHKYNYWKHLLKEEVVEQALPEIVPLSVPEVCEPSLPASSGPDQSFPSNRTIRANYTNPNVRFCIDGVSIEVDPAVPEEFLRTLIRAVHYA